MKNITYDHHLIFLKHTSKHKNFFFLFLLDVISANLLLVQLNVKIVRKNDPFNLCIFFISAKPKSLDFQNLKTLVKEIDYQFMILWSKTLNERKKFYTMNTVQKIFEEFPNLSQPSGKDLVRNIFLILI